MLHMANWAIYECTGLLAARHVPLARTGIALGSGRGAFGELFADDELFYGGRTPSDDHRIRCELPLCVRECVTQREILMFRD